MESTVKVISEGNGMKEIVIITTIPHLKNRKGEAYKTSQTRHVPKHKHRK